jgi:hypothetical protein
MSDGGQAHRDNIETQLGGMLTTHTTEGTTTGGTFTFNESDMRTVIKNWRDLARNYDISLAHSDRMTRIEPPAEDFASRAHAAAAKRSGQSYIRYLEHNRSYCWQQADLCQQALDDYLNLEQANATEMHKTAPEGPPTGV